MIHTEETVEECVEAPTKQYRMAALDLDGTLLHSNHKLSERTKTALHHLHGKGFLLMIATGRALTSVFEHVKDLRLESIPVVCANGARGVVCGVDDEGTVSVSELFYNPVPESIVHRTILEAREMGYVVQYYVNNTIYANPKTDFHRLVCEKYMALTGAKTVFVEDEFEAALQLGLPSKLLVLCPVPEQDEMMQHFSSVFRWSHDGEPPSMVRGSLGWFMEMLHPTVCKGNGLALMCHHLNIDVDDVVAFGDADNDYEFLQLAGKGVAMKNGQDVVKKVADQITDFTNNEDGVVRTLEAMENDGTLVFTTSFKL